MGFWHTGYMEFHEESGLDDFPFDPPPPQFPCAHCKEIYASLDELRTHRFESHPLRRPTLFLHGQELGTHPIRVTRPFIADDVRLDDCDRAFLNGREMPISTLPRVLSQILSDTCKLELSKADVSAEFTLDFRIASEDDLKGIEEHFKRTALGQQLDIRAIEEFIIATSGFGSALGYCDGICEYLYGVLAKQKAPDSSLPYEEYVKRFNKAAEELVAYERPLARTIGSLIEFHFNHFAKAVRLASETRVGRAATRYASWLQAWKTETEHEAAVNVVLSNLDAWVTDWETEQIIRWATRPLNHLSQHVTDMESFLNRDLAEYDSVKLHVLLGETYAASDDIEKALQHAKILRNLPGLETWAESMIYVHSEGHNGQL